ncbi:MAG: gliding motility-associated C-terminal domain-containing protein [Bacteroidia bacterium]|nr:gliding motility-associated C-terminal domain-containing protein [Bacteroidia bacterium]
MPLFEKKKNSLLRLFLVVILAFGAGLNNLQASHNLAGQITYIKTAQNTYEITLTTYTDPAPANVDRCEADFIIYDQNGVVVANINAVPRSNGTANDPKYPNLNCNPPAKAGEYVLGTIKKNVYVFTYKFSGPGNYVVTYSDHARWGTIINMANPGSTTFHVNCLIRNSNAVGSNDSPIFLQSPLTFACTGKLWTHNPGGFDKEGDSLAYHLIPNQKALNTPVDLYKYPSQFGGAFYQDPLTGELTWDTPQQPGAYNVAFVLEEYRNGVLIGEAVRDMVIFVEPCLNDPPIIEALDDTCVQAGDTLVFDFKVWDPNPTDSIYFYLDNGGNGLNGPFNASVVPGATITFNPPISNLVFPVRGKQLDTIRGTITWPTTCGDIRKSFYQIDMLAHDNFNYNSYGNPTSNTTMLTANHIVKIWVTPPRVTGLELQTGPHLVNLSWDKFTCPNAYGYHIYRRFGGGGILDTVCCDQTPESAGFERIYSTVPPNGLDETTYTDNLQGVNIAGEVCYLVVAYFDQNQLSCPSNLACVVLNTQTFLMTNDSVDVTDAASGSIFLSWSQPDTSVLDQVFFPPPYTYDLFRADGITGVNFTKVNASPLAFNDTTFLDQGLNTVVQGYNYYVQLNDAQQVLNPTATASSIFLKTTPGDKQIKLSWREIVPWYNEIYYIYRLDSSQGPNYVLIDSVPGSLASNHTYLDTGLTNYQEYCYYVLSKGQYENLSGVKNPLENASQKVCAVPLDLTPPCISGTDIDTSRNCVELSINFYFSELDSTCAGDLDHFNIYLSDQPGGPYSLYTTLSPGQQSYTINGLTSIADCYAISAVDTVGNESDFIEYCFQNCPVFAPSNVFTPNGDGFNDWFSPFLTRSVRVNKVLIFDRWGDLIYQSNPVEPHQLWNGIRSDGIPANEGVYYYVIEYEDILLLGNEQHKPLIGYVTLLR